MEVMLLGLNTSALLLLLLLFFKFYYLFLRDTQREAETQVEGEAGSMQGARCGTQSQDPVITPWPKADDAQPLSHPGIPKLNILEPKLLLLSPR